MEKPDGGKMKYFYYEQSEFFVLQRYSFPLDKQ